MTSNFRSLPAVDKILSHERVQVLVTRFSRQAILNLVREELDNVRRAVGSGCEVPALDQVVLLIEKRVSSSWEMWPSAIINATGVILHTNLGRAPLSGEALESVALASKGYSDLEIDLDTGKRSSRQAVVGHLIRQITGAEAGLVVNNNASAVLLGLVAVAEGKEVIISRGEAVEIGGGFRIPDILKQSGCKLVEVGTTNRTYVSDYRAAISDETGAILVVHTSNFQVTGFTHSPSLSELVELGKESNIPVLHDLGSGCLIDSSALGLGREPTPQESIADGVSLVFFSGDKLLGGPQAGLIAGGTSLLGRISRHSLARAVRIDKLSVAALTATLLHYIKDEVLDKVPVWRMISEPTDSLRKRVNMWQRILGDGCSVHQGFSTIGGGSMPGQTLPTVLLRIACGVGGGGAEKLASNLRQSRPPVVSRIENECVLLDPRTVLPEQDQALLGVLTQVLGR